MTTCCSAVVVQESIGLGRRYATAIEEAGNVISTVYNKTWQTRVCFILLAQCVQFLKFILIF